VHQPEDTDFLKRLKMPKSSGSTLAESSFSLARTRSREVRKKVDRGAEFKQ
jgi:hypothetical protein